MKQSTRVALLGLAVSVGTISAEISITLPEGAVSDPQVYLNNSSDETVLISGWRFDMSRPVENFRLEEIQGPLIQTALPSGGVQVESRPIQMWYKLLGMNQQLLAWYKLPWGADPVKLSNPRLLLKNRPEKLTLQDEPQIAVSDIASITAGENYYNKSYRQIDTLGIRGGIYSGGLFDTWYGETQIQMAVPDNEFVISDTPLKIDPTNTDGPLYWMGLAMAQEYRHIDFQWLMAIGAKETFAGTNSIYRGDNKERAFGPFEVESSTGSGKALAYYQFFPEHQDSLAKYYSLAEAMTSLGFDYDGVEFMAYYLDADFTPIGSAMTVNGALFSVLTWYFTYDLLAYAEDVCWFELLEEAKDPYIGLAAMSPIYNLGINGGGRDIGDLILPHNYKELANDPNGREKLPSGNSNYRQSVQIVVDQLINASKASLTDETVEIMDMPISLEQVQAFFFGDGGTAAQLGQGGLCHHFKTDREALWSTVTEAFNLLKGKAPSTEGTENISYRYDLLTLLRTVKDPFSEKRMAIHANEGNNWIRDYSKGSVRADGTPKDTIFPSASVDKAVVTFPLTVAVQDDESIDRVEWSVDPRWHTWHKAAGTGGSKEGTFTVSPAAGELPDVSAGGQFPIWIKVVDSSGNSEIQKLMSDGAVSVSRPSEVKRKNISISFVGDKLRITGLEKSSKLQANLYSLNGRLIRSLDMMSDNIQDISTKDLSKGIYLLQVTTEGFSRSFPVTLQ